MPPKKAAQSQAQSHVYVVLRTDYLSNDDSEGHASVVSVHGTLESANVSAKEHVQIVAERHNKDDPNTRESTFDNGTQKFTVIIGEEDYHSFEVEVNQEKLVDGSHVDTSHATTAKAVKATKETNGAADKKSTPAEKSAPAKTKATAAEKNAPAKGKAAAKTKVAASKAISDDEDVDDDDEAEEEKIAPAKTKAKAKAAPAKTKAAAKGKAAAKPASDEDEDDDVENVDKDEEDDDVFDVPTTESDVPKGTPNCLAGKTFLITGTLEGFDRKEATSLIEQYGGNMEKTLKKTLDYVVLGVKAGPKKLDQIKEWKLKTLDQKGLYDLIKDSSSAGGAKKRAAEPAAKAEAKKPAKRAKKA